MSTCCHSARTVIFMHMVHTRSPWVEPYQPSQEMELQECSIHSTKDVMVMCPYTESNIIFIYFLHKHWNSAWTLKYHEICLSKVSGLAQRDKLSSIFMLTLRSNQVSNDGINIDPSSLMINTCTIGLYRTMIIPIIQQKIVKGRWVCQTDQMLLHTRSKM